MWGCAAPVLTDVLSLAWDVMREAHGVGSGAARTNWHSLWHTEREYWSKPGGTRHRQSGRLSKMDCDNVSLTEDQAP